jgi:hypothetical protein
MIRGTFAVAAAAAFTLIGVAAPAPATADTHRVLVDLHDGSGWVHDSTTPLLDFTRLAPGSLRAATLSVRNDAADTAALALKTMAIRDDDNGCNHPEMQVDDTCGEHGGELGKELQLRVFVDPTHTATFGSSPSWVGTVYDLADRAAALADMPPNGEWDLKLEAELPRTSGNETQTDQLGFDLMVNLASAAGEDSTEVKGVKHVRGGSAGLPFTGSHLAGTLEIGVGLVLLGILALTSIRRKPQIAVA